MAAALKYLSKNDLKMTSVTSEVMSEVTNPTKSTMPDNFAAVQLFDKTTPYKSFEQLS